jgi:hypothetical protein
MDTHRPNQTGRNRNDNRDHRLSTQPRTDPLTVVAQSIESLQPDGAQPAWVEILGPAANPTQPRWHQGLDSLIGFVAPPGCEAIATVGYGWANNVSTGDNTPTAQLLAPGERRRCRVVFLMSRTGETAGYVRTGTEILINEPPTAGRIPDLLRRTFGLATPPPQETPAGLLARLWLSDAINAAEAAASPLNWTELASLHPAMRVAAHAAIAVAPEHLERVLRVAAEAWSWSQLARQAAQPGWLNQLLPPGAGGWMDEGILSRWVLDTLTPLDTLIERVTPQITPAARQHLRAVLATTGAYRPTGA